MEKKCSCNENNSKKYLKGLFPSLRGKQKKNSDVPKGPAVKEMLKDVFFIPSPNIVKVPVKLKRQAYYQENLVISALVLHSNMNETDIRTAIACRFDEKFPTMPAFVFVKAVGDALVETDVEEYDIKTCLLYTSPSPRDS